MNKSTLKFKLVEIKLFKLIKKTKGIIHWFLPKGGNKRVIFVVGCQRSGTAVLTRVFDRDLRFKVYGEFSKLSSEDKVKGLRLNPLPSVKEQLAKDRANLILLKPLVETQNINKLLNYFEDSSAIWIYRNYKDVATSNLKKFGVDNGIRNLTPIILDDKENWRSENQSNEVVAIVKKYYSDDMPSHDAAALFWYVRNSLFFSKGLDTNPKVYMIRYDDLVNHPNKVIEGFYKMNSIKYPGNYVTREINNNSVGKGAEIRLSEPIHRLCDDLLNRLNSVYAHKGDWRKSQVG